ncbi:MULTISPECIES: transposase [unclassified Streptomyces]|uniref:transposase n=1 Tax=unclassified Streptomyces TaxID=2593676 RepID=UPI001EF110AA
MGEGGLALYGNTAAALGTYLVFEDEAGFSMTPPAARTWSAVAPPRSSTSVAASNAASPLLAWPAARQPSAPGRPIDRPIIHQNHKAGDSRSFARTGYRLFWPWPPATRQAHRPGLDNLNVQDWITVHFLPPYAPQFNPVEEIWFLLRRRCRDNTAFTEATHLMRTLRQGTCQTQSCLGLIEDASRALDTMADQEIKLACCLITHRQLSSLC